MEESGREPNKSVVYFLGEWETKRVKIGFTTEKRFGLRMAELKNSGSVERSIMGYQPGDRQTEQALHRKFAHSRVGGEWFEMTDEIMAYIDANTTREWIGKRPEFGTTRRFGRRRRGLGPRGSSSSTRRSTLGRGATPNANGVIEFAKIDLDMKDVVILQGEYARIKNVEDADISEIVRWLIDARLRKCHRRERRTLAESAN